MTRGNHPSAMRDHLAAETGLQSGQDVGMHRRHSVWPFSAAQLPKPDDALSGEQAVGLTYTGTAGSPSLPES